MKVLNHKIYPCTPEADWVVLIHGVVGSIKTFDRQVAYFEQQHYFNILVIDLRDHGDSIGMPLPPEGISIELLSKDVVDLMDYLHIKSAHFVAVSISTVFVRVIEEQYPGYVKSIVLSGGVFKLSKKFYRMIRLGIVISSVFSLKRWYKYLSILIFPKPYQRKYRIIFIQAASKLDQKAFRRRLFLYKKLKSKLNELNDRPILSPCLVVMGDNDKVYLPIALDYITRYPQTKLQVIENCGHICNIESPESFNTICFDFIYQNTSSLVNA